MRHSHGRMGASWAWGLRVVLAAAVFLAAAGPALAAPPKLTNIKDVTLRKGSPLHIPVTARDPEKQPLTITVTSSSSAVKATVEKPTRSLRMEVRDFGVMTFRLFERHAPRATDRIIELAEDGFYDGLTFHRVIDDFVIQTGSPNGKGTDGSPLPDFDDQFHPDLQHNSRGILSMAKSGDDTNDSQFFITEGPARHLDFNHTVFGILTSGEKVREAISNVPTNSKDKPKTPVVIEKVEVFEDTQNGVITLKAAGSGSATITVTVRDAEGNTVSDTFKATIANGAPYLDDVRYLRTRVGRPITIQLAATDTEGDTLYFDAAKIGNQAYTINSVDHARGRVTLTPATIFLGNLTVLVGVRQNSTTQTSDAWDRQEVTVEVRNDPAPDAYENGNGDDSATRARKAPIDGTALSHTIDSASDQDWITFTLPAKRNVSITAAGADGENVRLTLYGPNTPNTQPDTGPVVSVAPTDASKNVLRRSGKNALAKGTYWVKVDGMGFALDSYTLSVTATKP